MNTLNAELNNDVQVLPVTQSRYSSLTRLSVAVLGFVILIGSAAYLLRISHDPARFPVSNVDVMGTVDYANRETMMAVVRSYTAHGFYGLDIGDLRRALEVQPWIGRARVSRVWPARITVEIEEHEPTARWNDDSLISKRLELFSPPQLQDGNARFAEWQSVFASLPQLRGVPGRHPQLLDTYREFDRQLESIGLTIDGLHEDERESLTLTLSNDVVVRLGYENKEIRMSRFLDVYERLSEKSTDAPLSFDMRYSNGFALGVVNDGG